MGEILTQEQWEYKKSFRSLVQDVLRYFGIMIFFKKRALSQPILAQIAQGSKWAILKQNIRLICQTGGFRGR